MSSSRVLSFRGLSWIGHPSGPIRPIFMGRIVPELDQEIKKVVDEEGFNPKCLATRRNIGFVPLPVPLEIAAQNKLKGVDKKFRSEADMLNSIMYNFKLPDTRDTVALKKADIKNQLEVRNKLESLPSFTSQDTLAEELDIANYELANLVQGKSEQKRRDWHYYEYDAYASKLYMAVRLAPNYACIKTVMNEIRSSDPSFEPTSVLDFGSGMGTTVWAVQKTWPRAETKFLNVDISTEQQHLCDFLLRQGRDYSDDPLPFLSHRQYLPSSNKIRYDMTVAAFSLLELPNPELRAHTIENLWSMTDDLLVLVERGNEGGFTALKEARNFLLDLGGHNVTSKRTVNTTIRHPTQFERYVPKCHIVAPCPHEYICPRSTLPRKKNVNICRFQIYFEQLKFKRITTPNVKEEFSYLVMRKRPHPMYGGHGFNSSRWPRIVEERKKSSEQITHHLCCPNGSLAETTLTRKRYGSALYEVAKSCDWGDILPIKVHDTYKKRTFNHGGKSSGSAENDRSDVSLLVDPTKNHD